MSIVFSAAATLSPRSRLLFPPLSFSHTYPTKFHRNGWHPSLSKSRTQPLITNSLLSDKFPTVGSLSTGPIPSTHLIEVVKTAAQTGAQVFIYLFIFYRFPLLHWIANLGDIFYSAVWLYISVVFVATKGFLSSPYED